jgi:hypothetical protein
VFGHVPVASMSAPLIVLVRHTGPGLSDLATTAFSVHVTQPHLPRRHGPLTRTPQYCRCNRGASRPSVRDSPSIQRCAHMHQGAFPCHKPPVPESVHVGMLSLWKQRVGTDEYYLTQVASGLFLDDYYSGASESPGQWVGGGHPTWWSASSSTKRTIAREK